jgi:peptidylprolyl isomerase
MSNIESRAMAKVRNNEYRQRNEAFMQALRDGEEELFEISKGVLVKIIEKGEGDRCPRANNVVTVHYKGSLINGKVFDNSWERGYPEAFRLNDLILGWQIALTQMHVGDHWIVYIPYEAGYGTRGSGSIPGYSTLIFEMKLVAIM